MRRGFNFMIKSRPAICILIPLIFPIKLTLSRGGEIYSIREKTIKNSPSSPLKAYLSERALNRLLTFFKLLSIRIPY